MKTIVSLTSIKAREHLLPAVLTSLYDQTVPPDEIWLHVSDHPYLLDTGYTDRRVAPAEAFAGRTPVLRVRFVPNTGPFRKLVPALEELQNEDAVIITADDDALYPRSWLAGLIAAYREKGCAIAYRTRAMGYRNGQLWPYRRWRLIKQGESPSYGDIAGQYHGLFTLGTGKGGVLYHPRFFPDLNLVRTLQALAPTQDDLVYRLAMLVAGVPTATIFLQGETIRSAGVSELTLYAANRSDNDVGLRALFAHLTGAGLFEWSRYLVPGAGRKATPAGAPAQ